MCRQTHIHTDAALQVDTACTPYGAIISSSSIVFFCCFFVNREVYMQYILSIATLFSQNGTQIMPFNNLNVGVRDI